MVPVDVIVPFIMHMSNQIIENLFQRFYTNDYHWYIVNKKVSLIYNNTDILDTCILGLLSQPGNYYLPLTDDKHRIGKINVCDIEAKNILMKWNI